jgi:hypothetical protein
LVRCTSEGNGSSSGRGCLPGGIVIRVDGPAEKSVVAFFTSVRPYENHGQNDLFKDAFAFRLMNSLTVA